MELKYLLSLVILVQLSIWTRANVEDFDKCRDTRHGVDSGLVRVPDFQDSIPANVTCNWSFTAPPGKKLLVKVDSVHYPPQDARDTILKLYLDEEVIDIPRNCVRCLKQVGTGHTVRILYSSIATSSASDASVDHDHDLDHDLDSRENALYADAGSFQIRYKAFDPSICDRPRVPLNGDATVTNRKIGHEVKYACNPPYDLFGKTSAVCQIPVDSPVPDWSNGPPKCGVSNCSHVPVLRFADSVNPGAIASPGYPNFKMHSSFNCEWVITADPGYQIVSFLSFLELTDQERAIGSLRLFDGERRTLLNADALQLHRNLTTKTNVLTVVFETNNTGLVEGGFYLNYVAVSASCPDPLVPENGEVVGYSYAVGSAIAYRCLPGFVLDGANRAECLVNAVWSEATPLCLNATQSLLPTLNGNVSRLDLPETETTVTPVVNATTETIAFTDPTIAPISAKVTKPSKKSKAIPTTKIPFKVTTVKPKHVKTVFSTKNDSVVSLEGEPAVAFASPANETLPEEMPPRTSENGISGKNRGVKPIGGENERKPSDQSEDEYGDIEDGDSDLENEGPHYDEFNPFEDPSRRPSPSTGYPPKDNAGSDAADGEDITQLTTYILIGVGVGCLLILLSVVIVLVVYRKRFPVRMRFGRKFSTFENPMYVANKDHDAQHPRELKRLTV